MCATMGRDVFYITTPIFYANDGATSDRTK